MLIRIVAPHFVAGIEAYIVARGVYNQDDVYDNKCAPIVKYMKFWSPFRIKKYCTKKNWLYQPMLD